MDFILLLLAFFLPPISVAIKMERSGKSPWYSTQEFWITLVAWPFGWVPGVVCAFVFILTNKDV